MAALVGIVQGALFVLQVLGMAPAGQFTIERSKQRLRSSLLLFAILLSTIAATLVLDFSRKLAMVMEDAPSATENPTIPIVLALVTVLLASVTFGQTLPGSVLLWLGLVTTAVVLAILQIGLPLWDFFKYTTKLANPTTDTEVNQPLEDEKWLMLWLVINLAVVALENAKLRELMHPLGYKVEVARQLTGTLLRVILYTLFIYAFDGSWYCRVVRRMCLTLVYWIINYELRRKDNYALLAAALITHQVNIPSWHHLLNSLQSAFQLSLTLEQSIPSAMLCWILVFVRLAMYPAVLVAWRLAGCPAFLVVATCILALMVSECLCLVAHLNRSEGFFGIAERVFLLTGNRTALEGFQVIESTIQSLKRVSTEALEVVTRIASETWRLLSNAYSPLFRSNQPSLSHPNYNNIKATTVDTLADTKNDNNNNTSGDPIVEPIEPIDTPNSDNDDKTPQLFENFEPADNDLICVLVGRQNAGKSSLQKALAGYPPSAHGKNVPLVSVVKGSTKSGFTHILQHKNWKEGEPRRLLVDVPGADAKAKEGTIEAEREVRKLRDILNQWQRRLHLCIFVTNQYPDSRCEKLLQETQQKMDTSHIKERTLVAVTHRGGRNRAEIDRVTEQVHSKLGVSKERVFHLDLEIYKPDSRPEERKSAQKKDQKQCKKAVTIHRVW